MSGRLAALCLEQRYQRSLLGSGLNDFLVGGELEVGEAVGVEVVVQVDVIEVHVLLLGAAGAGALRPQFLSELALRRVAACAVSRMSCSSARASRSAAYEAASSASKSTLAAALAAMSSSG
jgi:hypothetical protein